MTKFWSNLAFWALLLIQASTTILSSQTERNPLEISAFSVAFKNNNAYLAAGAHGFIALDCSNPNAPVRVGTYLTDGPAHDVVISGETAYVAEDLAGLQILDVTDASHPTLISSLRIGGSEPYLCISGKLLYFASGTGLSIVDVGDANNPSVIGSLATPHVLGGITLLNTHLYAADSEQGLDIFDVANPSAPVLAGSCPVDGTARMVVARQNYAYIAAGDGGLQIIDTSNPANPQKLASCQSASPVLGVTLLDRAALLTEANGFEIVDISTNSSPVKTSSLSLTNLTGTANTLYVGPKSPTAQNIILDCDPGNDADDMGDIAIMHALADMGELSIVAEMYSMHPAFGAPDIEIANRFFGRPDLPIGVSKTSGWDSEDHYGSYLQRNYYNRIGSGLNATNAVTLYREILANSPDHSMTVLLTGQLRNIYDLWRTGGDAISPLPGPELLAQKLKRMVVVAGIYPVGHEFNMYVDPQAAGILNSVTNLFPVTYVGIELGNDVLIGGNILTRPESDPIRASYQLTYNAWNISSREAWASLALLFIARGYNDGYVPLFNSVRGWISVDATNGSNSWTDDPNSTQEYLRFAQPSAYYASLLDHLLMRPPRTGGKTYSFIPDENGGLAIVDITQITAPQITGSFAISPQLRFNNVNGFVELRWTVGEPGWELQTSETLGGLWQTVMSGVELDGQEFVFNASLENRNQSFFRLKQAE
jgi:hypothetical protein